MGRTCSTHRECDMFAGVCSERSEGSEPFEYLIAKGGLLLKLMLPQSVVNM